MQPEPPLACWFGDSEFEPLVAAVIVAPSDNAPRLVLSDWLREHGDEIGAVWASRPSFIPLLAIIRLAHLRQLTGDELAQAFLDGGLDAVVGLAPAFRQLADGFGDLADSLETAQLFQKAQAIMARRKAADKRRASRSGNATPRKKSGKRRK